MKSELHLFIVWSKAIDSYDNIISDLKTKFDIIDVYLVKWDKHLFSSNLSRFYGSNLPDGSHKEIHCGRDDFILIIIRDHSPIYDFRETTIGREKVNTKVFDSKVSYRKMTGGGHKIHATNSVEETSHDLMLLLEKNINDYSQSAALRWDGKIKPIRRDLPGSDGWNSIGHLFNVLNATIPYVVLRNFECLPDQYNMKDHGDIDLLCDNLQNIKFISNAKPVFNNPDRVLHKIRINNQDVLFDFRYCGDNYYDPKWEKDILKRRKLTSSNFYVPADEDHFYSLLYHAKVHKTVIANDYIGKLISLSTHFNVLKKKDFSNDAILKSKLDNYLRKNKYCYSEPIDVSVHFNAEFVGVQSISEKRIFCTSPSIGSALCKLFRQTSDCSIDSKAFSNRFLKSNSELFRHFSSNRLNLISSIPFNNTNDVLEIGADSGLLTRYLGENFKRVYAIEINNDLAEAARSRCDNLTNVNIVNSFNEIHNKSNFDLVVITIDSRKCFNQNNSFHEIAQWIECSIQRLSPNGKLLLFIDNPLTDYGYLSSGPALNFEDNDSCDSISALNLGDILSYFKANNLISSQTFYLFPNNNSPRTIFTKEAIDRKLRAFGYWAGSNLTNKARGSKQLSLSGEYSKSGKLGDIAGGIAIMATHCIDDLPKMPWQVISFCDEYRPECTKTITQVKSGDNPTVLKSGKQLFSEIFSFDPVMQYPLFEGYLLEAVLLSNIHGKRFDRVLQVFRNLADYWKKQQKWEYADCSLPMITVPNDVEISGAALDAIPRNLMRINNDLLFFDNEWKSNIPLPLSYLLYRSIISLLNVLNPKTLLEIFPNNQSHRVKSLNDMIILFINQLNLFEPLSVHHAQIFEQFEQRFSKFAYQGLLEDDQQSFLELFQLSKKSYASNNITKQEQNLRILKEKYGNLEQTHILISAVSSKLRESNNLKNVSEYCRPNSKLHSSNTLPNKSFQENLTSIIILTFNQLSYTKKCVESIQTHTTEPHEIIFVDNASTDGTVKWLKSLSKKRSNYKLILNPSNMGFSKGCNQGIEASTGEFILLLNNDVIVTKNWLRWLLECLNSKRNIGIVGPMTNNISGPQKIPEVDYKSLGDLPSYAEMFNKRYRYRRIRHQRIVGFCMLFRRKLVEQIGLLDDSFGTGNFEDDDLCLRSVLHGYQNYIAADVFIHHFGSISFIGNKIEYGGLLDHNKNVFINKWDNIDKRNPLYPNLLTLKTLQRGNDLFNRELYDQCNTLLIDEIKRFPNNQDLIVRFAYYLKAQHRFEDALNFLEALPDDISNMKTLILKGYCLEGLGRAQEASVIAERLCLIDEGKAKGLNLKGILSYRNGDHEQATQLFNDAIAADPGNDEPYGNLGILAWETDKIEDAHSLFEKSFSLSPARSENATNYHTAALACGAIQKAVRIFSEAKALYPTNKRINFLYIDLLIKSEQFEAAMNEIEASINIFGIDEGIIKAGLEIRRKLGPHPIATTETNKTSISICMIVKNEQRYIARCLASVKPLADEMIVVDTGSSDFTRDIAEFFGAKVFDYQWNNDFASARNYSLGQASGDWVLVMDADEVISPTDYHVLLDLVRKKGTDNSCAYMMTTRNYTDRRDSADFVANSGKYQEEESSGWVPSKKVRLFRNHQGIHFVYPVHELVDPVLSEMGIRIKECSLPVHHYGKLDANRTSERWKLYYKIGKDKLESQPRNEQAIKEMAIQSGLLSKWEESIEYWEKYLALKPESLDAYLNLTRVLAKSGDFRKAHLYAQKAFDIDPDRAETIFNLGLAELQNGEADKASKTAGRLLTKFPEDVDGRLLQIIADICEGKNIDGAGKFQDLADTVPQNALWNRTITLISSINFAGFDTWIDSLVNELSVINGFEKLKTIRDRLPAPVKNATVKNLAAQNENPSTRLKNARQSYEREEYAIAASILKQLLSENPDHFAACELLADVLQLSGQEMDIRHHLSPLESRSNLSARILALIGHGYEASGNLNKAALFVDQSLSIDSECARAWNLKGVIAYQSSHHTKAAHYFQKASECDNNWGEPWTNMGNLHWEQGTHDKAIECFETGFQLSPTAPNVAITYHIAVSETGQYERARKVFENVVSRHPDFRKGRFLLIDILIRLKAYHAALDQIENVLVQFGIDAQLLKAAKAVRAKVGPVTISKGKRPSLSLCMIVKNEEKYLSRCLASLKPIVDEMIIVDTGSTDGTRDIAEVFGAKVFDYVWEDDFAAARNHSLDNASGDWILVMDADEVIAASDHVDLLDLIRNSHKAKVGYLITTRNYTHNYNGIGWKANDGNYPDFEAGCGWIPSTKTRLFKNSSKVRFSYPIHELVDPALENSGFKIQKCVVPVHHYGFLDSKKEKQKGRQYHKIGKKKLHKMKNDPQAINELAVQAGLVGDQQEAIRLWQHFTQLQALDPRGYINLSAAYCIIGEYKKSRSTALKAIKLDPKTKEGYLNLGRSEFFLGSYPEACRIFDKLVGMEINYYSAIFMLGAAQICCGDPDKGIETLQMLKSLSIRDSLPLAFEELANTLSKAGFDDDAQNLIHCVSRIAGVDESGHRQNNQVPPVIAKKSYRSHMADHGKKEKHNKKWFKNSRSTSKIKKSASFSSPQNAPSNHDEIGSAWTDFLKEDYSSALTSLNQYLLDHPDHWAAYELLVDVMLQSGQDKDIPDQLRALENRSDIPARMLALVGLGYEASDDLKKAAQFIEKALTLDAECARAWNIRGVIAYRNDLRSEAVQFFQKASECDHNWGDPWTNMGTLHWEQGILDKALDYFETGIQLSPTAPNVATTYHIAISETGQYERAMKFFEDSVSCHPDFRKGYFLLIDILIQLEAYQAALNKIETVLVRFGIDSQLLEAAKAVRSKVGPLTIKKNNHPSLSLCMIVKNEAKFLARCLASLKPMVDEMIIVDTGSTDATRDIAEVFGAKVFDYEWKDDFSAARNYSLEHATGDWILVMDADEVISPKDHKALRNLLEPNKSKPRALSIVTRNYTNQHNIIGWEPNAGQYPDEEADIGWIPSEKVRLFPNDKTIRFEYPVHEVVGPSLSRMNIPIVFCPCPVHHYGKLYQNKERQKDLHYFTIGMKKLEQIQDDPVPIREMAIQAAKLGKYEDAIVLWKQLNILEPQNARCYINISTNYGKLKQYSNAKKAAQKAIKIAPKLKEGHLNLGLSELHLGDVKRAEKIFFQILQKHPDYLLAVFLLASCQLCQVKTSAAAETLSPLKDSAAWDRISYTIQDLLESLNEAGWTEFTRNLIAGAIALDCYNEKILKYHHQIKTDAA